MWTEISQCTQARGYLCGGGGSGHRGGGNRNVKQGRHWIDRWSSGAGSSIQRSAHFDLHRNTWRLWIIITTTREQTNKKTKRNKEQQTTQNNKTERKTERKQQEQIENNKERRRTNTLNKIWQIMFTLNHMNDHYCAMVCCAKHTDDACSLPVDQPTGIDS